MAILILVRGCPGSGKTTFVSKQFPGIFHLENDMFHMRDGKYCFDTKRQSEAITWCLDTCEHMLKLGVDVVVSNTLTKRGHVDAYRQIAARSGANFKVYHMHGDFKNVHNVPKFILDNMKKNEVDWSGETHVWPNLEKRSTDDPDYIFKDS